ncbi:MAG: PKD domain-containing protein [Methanomassiliicoccales archaeon]|nr:MAG: PKD domain-containing protein [Methanomassiliicoccales archaeon]
MIYRRVVFMCIAIVGLLLFPMFYLHEEVGLDEASVTVTTDKDCYALGEMVTITLTNTGDETIAFLGVPPSWPDHSIWDDQMNPYYTISGINGSWVRMEPVMIIVATIVVDDFLLEPGESVDFVWNQTYLIYSLGEEGDEFYMLPPSWEQVPEGIYNAWAGGRMRVGDEVHLIGNSKEFRIGGCEGPETIEVSTDKYCYEIGEDVVITVEGRIWVPAVGSFPELFYAITNEKNESIVKPVNRADQMYYFEGPQTGVWNQTYQIYELGPPPVPPSGEQVPAGLYYIWFYEVNFSKYYGIGPAEILIGACGGPIADAGPNQTIFEGETAKFDGSYSVGSWVERIFSENLRVSEDHPHFLGFHREPQMHIDKNGTIHTIWTESAEHSMYAVLFYSKSVDGGLTFGPNVQIMNVTKIQSGATTLNPRFDLDDDGTIHVVWTSVDEGGYRSAIFYSKSTNGGASFDEPHIVLLQNISCGLSVDSERNIHLLTLGMKEYLYHLTSEDSGMSFGKLTRVTDLDVSDASLRCLLSRMVVDRFDNIHVAWPGRRIGEDAQLDVFYSKSEDGGLTFSANLKVHGETGKMDEVIGSMDVDSSGNPHVVWLERSYHEVTQRLMYSKSNDGGTTFEESIFVRSDEHARTGAHLVMASIAIGPDDIPRIAWIEFFKSSKDYNVWFSEFEEGQHNSSRRVLVTNHGRNDTWQGGPSLGVDEYGHSHVVWIDNREGEYEVYYARTVLGRVAIESYEWDMNNYLDSDGDGNLTNDVDAMGPTPIFRYGDDGNYTVTLRVVDEAGNVAYDEAHVLVKNLPPTIEFTNYTANYTDPRTKGYWSHQCTIEEPYADHVGITGKDVTEIVNHSQVFTLQSREEYCSLLFQESEDDMLVKAKQQALALLSNIVVKKGLSMSTPVNLPNLTDATTVAEALQETEEIILNTNDTTELERAKDIADALNNGDGVPAALVDFSATGSDPGSDDLAFLWDFGDGTLESHIYYNDGVNPDPYPSSEGVYPVLVTDSVRHAYWDRGTYNLVLTLFDDDSGEISYALEIVADRG